MLQKIILSFGSALLLIGCSEATRKSDSAELDTLLRAAVESRQVPAVVAMVASREGHLYQGAVGLPIDAIFAIASMTKAVTSVAVMQLIEAGKVRLDEPVHTYLPELRTLQVLDGGALRQPKSSPTVRHLLTHTSGFAYEFLNREIAEQVQSGKLASLSAGTDEFLRAPLVIDPGVRWEYGISTDWLGRLVETVTGQSLDAYFRSNVFEPLAMTETFFDVPSDKRPESRCVMHGSRTAVSQLCRGNHSGPRSSFRAAADSIRLLLTTSDSRERCSPGESSTGAAS